MSRYGGLAYSAYRRLPLFLQEAAVDLICARRCAHERGRAFSALVGELCRMQNSDPAGISEWQRKRLAAVLEAARGTDFYRPLLPSPEAVARDPEGVFRSLPVISRAEILESPARFLNEGRKGGIPTSTSGTTGTPLRVFWSRESHDWERALIWRHRLSVGCRMCSDWRGMLGGHRIVPVHAKKPPFWRTSRLAHLTYFSTYHLSPANAAAYAEFIGRRGIRSLEGYPSVLYALASSMEERGLSLSLSSVFFGAEPMHSFQKQTIERVFGCRAWDYYGLTERVASASEFECANGLHVNWENCILEILDPSGRPVDPGQRGEITGTSLSNLAFPILRYRTGDVSSFLEGPCTCGRHSPRIAPVDTKREDLLLLPDGSLLSASNLTFPFKQARNIRLSQIYQPETSRLVVRIVPAPGFSEEDSSRLRRAVADLLPKGVTVEIELVQEIRATRSGKYAFCVSEVSPSETGSAQRTE